MITKRNFLFKVLFEQQKKETENIKRNMVPFINKFVYDL